MITLALAMMTLALFWALSIGLAVPASERLRKARQRRATWGPQFPGFEATLAVRVDDESAEGTVRVAADGEVSLDLPEGELVEWALGQLRSEVMHLISGPALFGTEAEDLGGEGHPLGTLLRIKDDPNSSSYRVLDDRIREVNRTMGDVRFSIKTLLTRENAEGQSLPKVYSVAYWDAGSGALNKVETVEVAFERVGPYDLPARRTVVISRQGGDSVRRFELSGHRLLGG